MARQFLRILKVKNMWILETNAERLCATSKVCPTRSGFTFTPFTTFGLIGKALIDIREFYEDRGSGEERPGKKGISLSREQVRNESHF